MMPHIPFPSGISSLKTSVTLSESQCSQLNNNTTVTRAKLSAAKEGGHLLLKTANGSFQLVKVKLARNQTTTSISAIHTTQSATPHETIQESRVDDTSVDKCRKFLINSLELCGRQPGDVKTNVIALIQDLINAKVEPEAFLDRLEKLLNTSPQPCLRGFLKKSLPGLRAAMVAKEISIDGIQEPRAPSQSTWQTQTQVKSSSRLRAPSITKEKMLKNVFRASTVPALQSAIEIVDVVNDVAAITGVNLAEESRRLSDLPKFIGSQMMSYKAETFLHKRPLTAKILQIAKKYDLEEPNSEVIAMVSQAIEERLKHVLEKLNVLAEHKADFDIKTNPSYEVSQDIRGQLRFLKELDEVERKRHDEMERVLLLKAVKIRSKDKDPVKTNQVKELLRAEVDKLRQKETNLTALQAIGPHKKLKMNENNAGSVSLASRPRVKRVTIRDFLYVLEKDKRTNRSSFLFKSYLK